MHEEINLTDPTDFARDIIFKYKCLLQNTDQGAGADREQVRAIRDKIREDEDFWNNREFIAEFDQSDTGWVMAIIRVEAKRMARGGSEKFEEMRREREAARAAELEAEKKALEGLANFGMF